MSEIVAATILSTKGQIVIPEKVRERLGLVKGDIFRISIEKGCIVLRKLK